MTPFRGVVRHLGSVTERLLSDVKYRSTDDRNGSRSAYPGGPMFRTPRTPLDRAAVPPPLVELPLRTANCPSKREIWCSERHSGPSEQEICRSEEEISRSERDKCPKKVRRWCSELRQCSCEGEISRSEGKLPLGTPFMPLGAAIFPGSRAVPAVKRLVAACRRGRRQPARVSRRRHPPFAGIAAR